MSLTLLSLFLNLVHRISNMNFNPNLEGKEHAIQAHTGKKKRCIHKSDLLIELVSLCFTIVYATVWCCVTGCSLIHYKSLKAMEA